MRIRTSMANMPVLALLFIAAILPSNAQSDAAAEAEAADEDLLVYIVGRTLSVRCGLPNDKAEAYVWKKNGTNVDELWDVKGRYITEEGGAVWNITGRSTEDDFGNYTCAVGGQERTYRVHGRTVAKLEHNTNVVEGQKLKLVCKVTGKPYPPVRWTYSNSSDETDNGTAASVALADRVTFEASDSGVPDAVLLIETARRTDYGRYTCIVDPTVAGGMATTTVRVKDMYAALWPFLGICAEVVVLCAVILVYERRRTKPELDDSDTDVADAKKS